MTDATTPTIADILNQALEATRTGRMTWEKTSGRGASYDGCLIDVVDPLRFHMEVTTIPDTDAKQAVFFVTDGHVSLVMRHKLEESPLAQLIEQAVADLTAERQADLARRAMNEFEGDPNP
jgi:hypothetical protein